MLPKLRFKRVLWTMIFTCSVLITAYSGSAEAEEVQDCWLGVGSQEVPAVDGEFYNVDNCTTTYDWGPGAGDSRLSQEPELIQPSIDYLGPAVASYGDGSGDGEMYQENEVDGRGLNPLEGDAQDLGSAATVQAGVVPLQNPDPATGYCGFEQRCLDQWCCAGTLDVTPAVPDGGALAIQPGAVDANFIGQQEGFRLDAYVPDPVYSRSGATVGAGIDIGQMSVGEIETLDIPRALREKLKPYAGVIGQDAVYLLNRYPLYLTEDEAGILGRAKSQKIFNELAANYNTIASPNSFTGLPSEAQTVIADLAFQYGPDLAQRMPRFWSDVAGGRWVNVVQKLRDFGDRYPTRRNAEADLLQRAIDRGALIAYEAQGDYIVQPGDTLSEIAARLGASIEDLALKNGIIDYDTIYSGQVLYY